MPHLPLASQDKDLIAFVDGWARLMESEDYPAAFAYTAHAPQMGWTPDLIREVVKAYGERRSQQKVTLEGAPTDVSQRKEVSRWPANEYGEIAEIWYDLNIDGFVSDLTATFQVIRLADGITVSLKDIHVM